MCAHLVKRFFVYLFLLKLQVDLIDVVRSKCSLNLLGWIGLKMGYVIHFWISIFDHIFERLSKRSFWICTGNAEFLAARKVVSLGEHLF